MQYHPTLLQNARLLKGKTRTEVASDTGLSFSTVATVERGEGPWIKAIRRLCTYYGLDLADVLIMKEVKQNGKRMKAS